MNLLQIAFLLMIALFSALTILALKMKPSDSNESSTPITKNWVSEKIDEFLKKKMESVSVEEITSLAQRELAINEMVEVLNDPNIGSVKQRLVAKILDNLARGLKISSGSPTTKRPV